MQKIIYILFVSLFLFYTSFSQSGLYMRTQFFGSELNISWLYFTPEKKLIINPKFGTNPIQIQKELSNNSKNFADFIISNQLIQLKWGDGKKNALRVDFKNGILTGYDGGICIQATPFKMKYFQDKVYSGLATFGNISRSITIFFYKDGTFKTERVGAVSGSGNISGAAATQGTENGNYIINGNTIVFKYSNGSEWRAVAQPYDLGNEEIIINDQLFKKLK